MTHTHTAGPAFRTGRLAAWSGAATIVLAALSAHACASAPVAPPAKVATVPVEQKMAWMLQLEDQRILKLPEPPPPPPPPPVKGASGSTATASRVRLPISRSSRPTRIRECGGERPLRSAVSG